MSIFVVHSSINQNLNQSGLPYSISCSQYTVYYKARAKDERGLRSKYAKETYFHRDISKVYQTSPLVYSYIQIKLVIPFEQLNPMTKNSTFLILHYGYCMFML